MSSLVVLNFTTAGRNFEYLSKHEPWKELETTKLD